jgi:Tol biopolymer transport system component
MHRHPCRTAHRTRSMCAFPIALAIAACSDSTTGTRPPPPLVDDRLVAFVSDSDNSCCMHSSIFIMQADGSHTMRLTSADHGDDTPAWSPDGSMIAFFSDRQPSGIWVVNSDGSNLRRLATAPEFNFPGEPAWSPDGRSIAFSTFYTDSLGSFVDVIGLADADGSHAHQLMTHATQVGSPSWSRDGTRILFMAGDVYPHIYVVNTDGSHEQQLTNQLDREPQWSPDGSQIAFSTLDTNNTGILAQIVVARGDGSNRRTLTRGRFDRTPAWSPDGRQIAYEDFERDSTAATRLSPRRIFRMNVDGSAQRAMTSDTAPTQLPFNSWAPAWKPVQ